jgi:hypothetical protein
MLVQIIQVDFLDNPVELVLKLVFSGINWMLVFGGLKHRAMAMEHGAFP